MRYMMFFSAVLLLLTGPARSKGEDLDPAVLIELAKAKRLREAAPQPAVKATLCGCGKTGNCTCWQAECRCPACGLGGAAKQAGKPQPKPGSPFTPITPVQIAGTPAPAEPEPGSNGATPQPERTYTLVPSAGLAGSISGGCSNGQCQTQNTGRFRRR